MQHLHQRVASIFSRFFLGRCTRRDDISDASSCQEQEQIDGVTQNFKSQQSCITTLAPGNALNAVKMLIHPLSWSSTRIRRVCRSTLMAEAYALSKAVEHVLRTGATIVDMRGLLNSRQWEETVSAVMVCRLRKPLFSSDTTEFQTGRQQALAFDLSALKQLIWVNRDECDEEVDGWSSLDRYVRDAGRLLSEDDDFWPIEWNVEYGYVWHETYWEESRHKTKNRKWRASKKEQEWLQCSDTHARIVRRVRLRSCEAVEYLKREVCRLMPRMLSPSTGSELFRPRHFLRKWRQDLRVWHLAHVHLCHLLQCQHRTCVHFRRALESQSKAVFSHWSTHPGCTDQHTAHSPHNPRHLYCRKPWVLFSIPHQQEVGAWVIEYGETRRVHHQKPKTPRKNDNEGVRGNPLRDLPGWLQECTENQVDESVPEHRDAPSSSRELSSEPRAKLLYGKHSMFIHFRTWRGEANLEECYNTLTEIDGHTQGLKQKFKVSRIIAGPDAQVEELPHQEPCVGSGTILSRGNSILCWEMERKFEGVPHGVGYEA